MTPPRAAVLLALLAASCAPLPEERLEDRGRLAGVRQGMPKEFLLNHMGSELMTVRDPDGRIRQIVPNPYETRLLELHGKKFEIVYYFTAIERSTGPVRREELTPFVFDNNVLIGSGWDFMEFLKESAETAPEPSPEPAPEPVSEPAPEPNEAQP